MSAPASAWWGSGAEALALSGVVGRAQFVPLYAKGVRPGDDYLGRRFRLPEEAAAAKAAALLAASEIVDPYERWTAKHDIRRRGGHASVAAWDCTFSPPKSVSLLWAAGDRNVRAQVWAAHLAAVDAGLAYLEEHAAYVRVGCNGVRVLDTFGLMVARTPDRLSGAAGAGCRLRAPPGECLAARGGQAPETQPLQTRRSRSRPWCRPGSTRPAPTDARPAHH